MKRQITTILLCLFTMVVSGQAVHFSSPDQSIEVALKKCPLGISYSIEKNKEVLISDAHIGFNTDLLDSKEIKLLSLVSKQEKKESYTLPWGTQSELHSTFTEGVVALSVNMNLEFRVYNSGVAWRFVSLVLHEFCVYDEGISLPIDNNATIYYPEVNGFSTPFEPSFNPIEFGQLEQENMAIAPFLWQTPSKHWLLFSEVNLVDYPGLFLQKTDNAMQAVFPHYPAKESEQPLGRWGITDIPQLSKKMVRKTEDYIAMKKTRAFPWRCLLIADHEIDLLENTLIAELAEKPTRDYSWVKPGKVVWDWYYDYRLFDVDFKSGINTQTYKYLIDFAAKNNIPYVNIDDGWSRLHDLHKINPKLDLEYLFRYAKEKHVGLFLWCTYQTLEKNLEEELDYVKSLGAVGLKVDFFDRADQVVVDFIDDLASESAKRELMLNLHGVFKPAGIQITHPNVVNLEGVLGLENNKFNKRCTPTHNLTLPFTRNVVGPMDYTPGAMRFQTQQEFKKSWNHPHAMTTKAQQMAMYVVYHGGVQMLADSPTFYEKDPVALTFLSDVPVSWDETRAIEGTIGEYVAVARRKGEKWYVAAMTSNKARIIKVPLHFLGEQLYKATQLSDGETAEALVETISKGINSDTIVELDLKPTGGSVLILQPEN